MNLHSTWSAAAGVTLVSMIDELRASWPPGDPAAYRVRRVVFLCI